MTTKQDILNKSEEIKRIAARHGAHNVRVFGSVARNEAKQGSDLDLLIEAGPNLSPWFPAGLILELENLLGCRVEVVTEKALNPLLRERVITEAIQI
ncbi:MAG: nucleotidyltransferase family protein [Acidobacteria bacterium]|nr:nucleotidyltransferase family protein [Acidobacteriota bacterium]